MDYCRSNARGPLPSRHASLQGKVIVAGGPNKFYQSVNVVEALSPPQAPGVLGLVTGLQLLSQFGGIVSLIVYKDRLLAFGKCDALIA